jgi:hypothetical protein
MASQENGMGWAGIQTHGPSFSWARTPASHHPPLGLGDRGLGQKKVFQVDPLLRALVFEAFRCLSGRPIRKAPARISSMVNSTPGASSSFQALVELRQRTTFQSSSKETGAERSSQTISLENREGQAAEHPLQPFYSRFAAEPPAGFPGPPGWNNWPFALRMEPTNPVPFHRSSSTATPVATSETPTPGLHPRL